MQDLKMCWILQFINAGTTPTFQACVIGCMVVLFLKREELLIMRTF